MSTERFKELLSGKIDSLERWRAVCDEANFSSEDCDYNLPTGVGAWHYPGGGTGLRYLQSVGHLPIEDRWWLLRETWRAGLGVYPPPTSVMENVIANMRLGPHCIHISRDDPNLVAYTPSPEDGKRDKQVRLTFGKLLRKLCILLTDNHIQQLEAMHRSELDPTFLRATTPAEIQRVYTRMEGDTGCMRHPPSNWSLPDGLHPSAAYAYAGLCVAYTEIDGRIKSRCVIYENPDDPKDKRYVRVYGDPALTRKLERSGYRCDNLQGVKLRAISVAGIKNENVDGGKWKENHWLVPYLDGAGGNQSQEGGSYGYMIQGEDCIRLIDRAQASRLNNMGIHTPRFKSTGAVHEMEPVPAQKLQATCAVSGKVVNVLDEPMQALLIDGEIKVACDSVRHSLIGYDYTLYDYTGGQARVVLCTRADRTAYGFNDTHVNGYWTFKAPHNYEHLGYRHLNPAKYGEGVYEYDRNALVKGKDGTWFRKADCTLVLDAEGNDTWMISEEAEALKKADKNYIALAPVGKSKAMSHKSNPRLVKTRGKRHCDTDFHSVVELFDGTWDYETNTTWLGLMGMDLRVPSEFAEDRIAVRLDEAAVTRGFASYVEAANDRRDLASKRSHLQLYAGQRIHHGVNEMTYTMKGGRLAYTYNWYERPTLAAQRLAIEAITTASDEQLAPFIDANLVPHARCWAHHAGLILKIVDAKIAEWNPPAPAVTENTLDSLLTTAAQQAQAERFPLAA